jgi:hypothetical protein
MRGATACSLICTLICSLVPGIGLACVVGADNSPPPPAQPTIAIPKPEAPRQNPPPISLTVAPLVTVEEEKVKPALDDALLKQKLAELKQLQAEIQELRHAAVAGQRIRVEMKSYEVSLTKLERLGLDLSQFGFDFAPPDPSLSPAMSVSNQGPALVGSANSKTIAAVVELLRRAKLLTEVSSNDSSRTAIEDGGKAYFLASSRDKWWVLVSEAKAEGFSNRGFGLQVDLKPTLLSERQIRLDVLAKLSTIDTSVSITLNGTVLAGIRVHEIEAPCEMELGTTAVLAGLPRQYTDVVVDPETGDKSSVSETTMLLFLFTPELAGNAAK